MVESSGASTANHTGTHHKLADIALDTKSAINLENGLAGLDAQSLNVTARYHLQ